MKELVMKYFDHFSSKDLGKLSDIYSEEVTLQDWDITAKGKANVLRANKRIFDSVQSLSVKSNELYACGNVVICQIQIVINNKETLNAVDIIKVNTDRKIIEISAYKQ